MVYLFNLILYLGLITFSINLSNRTRILMINYINLYIYLDYAKVAIGQLPSVAGPFLDIGNLS